MEGKKLNREDLAQTLLERYQNEREKYILATRTVRRILNILLWISIVCTVGIIIPLNQLLTKVCYGAVSLCAIGIIGVGLCYSGKIPTFGSKKIGSLNKTMLSKSKDNYDNRYQLFKDILNDILSEVPDKPKIVTYMLQEYNVQGSRENIEKFTFSFFYPTLLCIISVLNNYFNNYSHDDLAKYSYVMITSILLIIIIGVITILVNSMVKDIVGLARKNVVKKELCKQCNRFLIENLLR